MNTEAKTNRPDDKKEQKTGSIKFTEVSFPKGGGAVRGIGGSFKPALFTGAGTYSIQVPATAARGLEPQLTLDYNSGSGNSEFGLGFSLSLPLVHVDTNKRIPQYDGNDTYSITGQGKLTRVSEKENGDDWRITSFSPRVESSYSKIEQWLNRVSGESYWMVLSRDNVTTCFGKSENARIGNPSNKSQVFKWLPEEICDSKNNKIVFSYKCENEENVPNVIYEKDRRVIANKYLSKVQYGNYFNSQNEERYAFEIIFDYGEYELSNLQSPGSDPHTPVRSWLYRPDAFSSYQSGFEIRTYRLCRNVLLFHNFENETNGFCLVKSLSLSFSQTQDYGAAKLTTMSMLSQATLNGYRKKEDSAYDVQGLPPVEFTFSAFNPPEAPQFKELTTPYDSLPGYLDAAGFLPVDLNGDGLPGFLYAHSQEALYFGPRGNGEYDAPRSCIQFPINKDLADTDVTIADIDGNGQLQLVVNKINQPGFYQQNHQGSWDNFETFQTYPTDIQNVCIERADLDGDGKADLLLADSDDILVYPSQGKKGYKPGQRIPNEHDFPLSKPGFEGELVTFADLFGDGLPHRIRIRSGSVECWPCLGYGKFGERITLGNAPHWGDNFDNRRIFLTDIDGSGPSDIVYAYPDRIEVFFNQNGNSFSEPVVVMLPNLFSNVDRISFADILGNGTTCLVFTKIAPAVTHYYYDFTGEVCKDGISAPVMKPYLLVETDNNIGSKIQIQYGSSTKFAMEDKQAGRPWATKLRFPVQLVEQVTVTDKISGARYVTKQKYHEGYYDTVEREFRGFGYVESWDAETYAEFEKNEDNPDFPYNRLNKELFVSPAYTKSWFHTGSPIENGIISQQFRESYFHSDKEAYDFPDSILDEAIYQDGYETVREAYVALCGRALRKEVYAADDSALSLIPYSVEEQNYQVRLVQPLRDGQHAVFQVNNRESISYQYERDAGDPRVQQQFTLDTDPLSGEVRRSCAVFLPRRKSPNRVTEIYPEQETLSVTGNLTNYINTSSDEHYRWRGVIYEAQEFELFQVSLGGKRYLSFDDAARQFGEAMANIIPYGSDPVAEKPTARQISANRTYFWSEMQTDFLPLGEISSRSLKHHAAVAVFTPELIAKTTGNKLERDIIEARGGYFFDEANGYWWNRGLIQHYHDPSQPEKFYQPAITDNSFVTPSSALYSKSTAEYDVPFFLMPVVTRRYLDDDTPPNTETFLVDYQAMQYKQKVDMNNNVSQVIFDPLGDVVVSTLFGIENNVPTGGMRLYKYDGEPSEYVLRKPVDFNDVLTNRSYYLQGATTFFYYNLFAFMEGDAQPVGSITLLSSAYYRNPAVIDDSCQVVIEYTDGLGRSIEKKLSADPAPTRAISPDDAATRWQVTGRTVYNNKGAACETYFPYFSDTPRFQTQREVVDKDLAAPPTIMHYDPLSRVIRADTPKGFFSKVAFTPWQEIAYDEDDTVLDSPFYKENYPDKLSPDEIDAIDKAAVFFNTPVIKTFSNMGFVFRETRTLPGTEELTIGYILDISGRILEVADARFYEDNRTTGSAYYNFKYRYTMGDKNPMYTDSCDAGIQLHFSNIFGNQLWSWSPRDYCQIISYDRLQRKQSLYVKKIDGNGPMGPVEDFNLVEVFTYGEITNGQEYNLRGQLYQLKDLAGITTNNAYSMEGCVLHTSKQQVKDYKTPADWNGPVPLEDTVYNFRFTYDALSRLLTEASPDGSITNNTYNQAGLLDTLAVTHADKTIQPIITGVEYNANEQRTVIWYANGIKSSYTYESTTLRLLKLFSSRRQAAEKPKSLGATVQDISYTYDPVGNITRKRDNTFETIFTSNQQVDPLSDYTYTAIYQLEKASGRQHQGISANTYKNNRSAGSFKQCIFSEVPAVNDGEKLENYTERYAYDRSGNLVSKTHAAASSSWTVLTPVLDNSNHMKGYDYDASGNMRQLQIDNTVSLSYNCCENLVRAAVIERPDEPDDADYYVYDSQEQRSRKVSERMTQGGVVTQVDEKLYFGNYEIFQAKLVDQQGNEAVTQVRQTLRVMDGSQCLAIIHYWVIDKSVDGFGRSGTRQLRYQMDDNLGSVSLEMDKDALLISYEEYFPYGSTAIIAGSNQAEVALKEYRYSGKECDDSTGLYYYGMRYYVPWLGRWLNPDPAGTVDGTNLYAFVGGNPVSYSDDYGTSRRNRVAEARNRAGRAELAERRNSNRWTTRQIVGLTMLALLFFGAMAIMMAGPTGQQNNTGVVRRGPNAMMAPHRDQLIANPGGMTAPSTYSAAPSASSSNAYTPPADAATYSLSWGTRWGSDMTLSYSGGKELRSKNDFTEDGMYLYAYVKESNSIRIHALGDTRFSNDLKHSQIAEGKDVYGAGHFHVKNGQLTIIDNASGHYQPDTVSIDSSGPTPELVYAGGSLEIVRAKVRSLGIDVSKTSLSTIVRGTQMDELNRLIAERNGNIVFNHPAHLPQRGTATPDQFKRVGSNGRLM